MTATLPGRVVRVGRPSISARVDVRSFTVTVGLGLVALAAFLLHLSVGDYSVPVRDVVETLLGGGDPGSVFVVRTLRLPRALTGLLVGAAFGGSGALFQTFARNPLASPDVLGIEAGAATGAVALIVLTPGAAMAKVATAALVGGLGAAAFIYTFAWRGGVSGHRFVLVGIAVAAILTSTTSYLLTRARIQEAQRAYVWLAGSLNNRGWEHVRPVGLALLVLIPAGIMLLRPLGALQLGDEAALGLGVRLERSRFLLLLVAVGLASVATASAGPVAFAALAAPQIARRLVGGRAPAFVASCFAGAALLLVADLIGRRVMAPTELPVGIITSLIGAPFLLWLLARANRVIR